MRGFVDFILDFMTYKESLGDLHGPARLALREVSVLADLPALHGDSASHVLDDRGF